MNLSNATMRLGMLDSSQIQRLHKASLDILSSTGVAVRSDEALLLLRKAGATVDGERVRMSGSLVDAALSTAPKSIPIYDRSGNIAMTLAGRNNYFGTGSDCPSVFDPETGLHRQSGKADVARIARLCDGLPNVDFFMSMGIASDASRITSYVHQFDAMVRNTTKPLVFTAHDGADMRDIFDLAAVVVGDAGELEARPRYTLYNEPISPLLHTPIGMEKLFFAAEHNIPMIYIGSPMMGASAPATMAGCIAQANAESLSGLVIQQLKKPGAPFIYGADATVMDMRTMTFAYGAPELQLINVAFADLAHHYGLPLFCIAGASDSKVVDAQTGAEMALSLLISAMNGCNLIHDIGYLESGCCSSVESIVLADELVGSVKRYLRGFDISEETLALGVIDRVGPTGNFLSEDHTLDHYRRDAWFPTVFDRRAFENWAEAGCNDVTVALHQKGMDILDASAESKVSASQAEQMDKVLARRG